MSIKSGKQRGRPLKLTKELQDRFCDLVRKGNYYNPVCKACGIHYSSFREWMTHGEQDIKKIEKELKKPRDKQNKDLLKPTIYSNFLDAVTEANGYAEINVVGIWQNHLERNATACREFLERRYSDRWGRKDERTLKGDLQINIPELEQLSDEELDEIINE